MDNSETLRSGERWDRLERANPDPWNAAFYVLSSRRRRSVLSLLQRASHPVSVDVLTDHLVTLEADHREDAESDPPLEDSSSDRRALVSSALHHIHLPVLAEAGVIEWDADRGVVRPRSDSGPTTYLAGLSRRREPAAGGPNR